MQKAERAEQAQRDYEKYLAEQDRRKAVVAELRTHGSHNYSHVRSREKQLAKLEVVEARTSQKKSPCVWMRPAELPGAPRFPPAK